MSAMVLSLCKQARRGLGIRIEATARKRKFFEIGDVYRDYANERGALIIIDRIRAAHLPSDSARAILRFI